MMIISVAQACRLQWRHCFRYSVAGIIVTAADGLLLMLAMRRRRLF